MISQYDKLSKTVLKAERQLMKFDEINRLVAYEVKEKTESAGKSSGGKSSGGSKKSSSTSKGAKAGSKAGTGAGKTASESAVPSVLAEVCNCATVRICKLPPTLSYWIRFSDRAIAC